MERTARSKNIRDLVLLALFTAIILLLGFTPLGYIDLPFIKATILHIPVLIGACLMGPKKGAFLGAMMGLQSIIKNTMMPAALSFAFSPLIPVPGTQRGSLWALVICFVPRILIGLVGGLVFLAVKRVFAKKPWGVAAAVVAAAVVGTLLVNTCGVMGLIYILFKEAYAAMKGVGTDAVLGLILGVVAANGIPETIAAAVITPAVVLPLRKALKIDN